MIGLPDNTVSQMMSVKEVAEALGVTPEAIKKHVRELYPEAIANGKETMLAEVQIVEIKRRMRPTTEVVGATTSLEMMQKAAEVMSWLKSESDRLRAELHAAQPAIECAAALIRSDQHMSITDAAKHFRLHPRAEVIPYLREKGYLTLANLPTQDAIDADYLELKETLCQDGEMRGQAVVATRQLETWRLRVIPQIKRWKMASA
jgi:phage antirepressor YoqD-like protein